jgi:hypothetical protein
VTRKESPHITSYLKYQEYRTKKEYWRLQEKNTNLLTKTNSSALHKTSLVETPKSRKVGNHIFQSLWVNNFQKARHQWLMPVILATQVAKIKRMAVWSQPRHHSSQNPISKKKSSQKRASEMVQTPVHKKEKEKEN